MPRPFKRRDLVAILITVVVVLAVVVVPALGRAKQKAARISCVCHVKKIGLALRIWANDNDDLYPMSAGNPDDSLRIDALEGRMFRLFQVLSNEFSVPKSVICPSDTRSTATNWTSFANENVSYFIGLDANDTQPNMVLSGDRNFTLEGRLLSGVVSLGTNSPVAWAKDMHRQSGNIGLADGSVQQVTTELLRQQLKNSGDTTNLLVFPQ
jgi:hypothetical protein